MGDVRLCSTGVHLQPLFLPKVATEESLTSPIRDREQCPITVRANTRDHTLSWTMKMAYRGRGKGP